MNIKLYNWAKNIYDVKDKSLIKYSFTKDRYLTKKAVLWLGQTCNLSCYFCYFAKKIEDKDDLHHDFMSIEKAKKICYTLRYIYGNKAIDIQGGEPTIYPKIIELVSYCHKIGLEPTLITNGIVLNSYEICEAYKKAGIKDFLISIHAIGDVYDEIVVQKGASKKQLNALKNLQMLGIPFRFNCTLTLQTIDYIEEITQVAIDVNAKAFNFIVFNPNEDQKDNTDTRNRLNVATYTKVKEVIEPTIKKLENYSIETNIRYLPLCMLDDEYRKNIYGMYQVPYDHNEWDFNSWTWTTRLNQRSNSDDLDKPLPILLYNQKEHNDVNFDNVSVHGTKEHYLKNIDLYEHVLKLFNADISKDELYYNNAKLRVEKHLGYIYSEKCEKCSLKNICDGLHGDYIALFGDDEIKPIILDNDVEDVKFYIKNQDKAIY